MTINAVLLVFAVAGGIAAGIVFFGGLWWTVQRIPNAKSPALLLLGSSVIRLLLAMVIFYAVMTVGGHMMYLIVAMVAFIAVRTVMVNVIRPRGECAQSGRKEKTTYAIES